MDLLTSTPPPSHDDTDRKTKARYKNGVTINGGHKVTMKHDEETLSHIISCNSTIQLQDEIVETLSSAAATALSIESVLEDLVCLTDPKVNASAALVKNKVDELRKDSSKLSSTNRRICKLESIPTKQERLLSSLRSWGDVSYSHLDRDSNS
mmetsp:Transcript_41422/g.97041  ORF Transcript_41422/g.97041 Transcript_41422/m.97041 type:complete len:152 (+) Transcript_41422:145-600(+)